MTKCKFIHCQKILDPARVEAFARKNIAVEYCPVDPITKSSCRSAEKARRHRARKQVAA